MSCMDDFPERKRKNVSRYSIYLFIYSSLSCQNTWKTVFLREVLRSTMKKAVCSKCRTMKFLVISVSEMYPENRRKRMKKESETGTTIYRNKLNWNFDAVEWREIYKIFKIEMRRNMIEAASALCRMERKKISIYFVSTEVSTLRIVIK